MRWMHDAGMVDGPGDPIRRLGSFLLSGAVAALVILLVAACGGKSVVPEATSTAAPTIAPGTVVTMYASPT